MILVAVMVLALIGASWAQMRYLAPVHSKTEWAVFISLMVLVALVGTSLILDFSLPNPISLVRGLTEPIGRAILH